jgi:DNA-binding XRE family transcriptional regulator
VKHCVNPQHLILGTHQQNTQDAIDAGRLPRGNDSPKSILTEAQVVRIKKMLSKKKLRHWHIAQIFGVSRTTITDINMGSTWSWL